MKVLIQRVRSANVVVAEHVIGSIQQGLLAFVGIEKTDTPKQLQKMAAKLLAYRVFSDSDGKMNLSLRDVGGGLLVVSQFTLAADTQKGLRPSFSSAAAPDEAAQLYQEFVNILHSHYSPIATGKFGADMQVSLVNDGPVTFLLQEQ